MTLRNPLLRALIPVLVRTGVDVAAGSTVQRFNLSGEPVGQPVAVPRGAP